MDDLCPKCGNKLEYLGPVLKEMPEPHPHQHLSVYGCTVCSYQDAY